MQTDDAPTTQDIEAGLSGAWRRLTRKQRRAEVKVARTHVAEVDGQAYNPRRTARKLILRTANAHLRSERTLTMKHLQEAVAICRVQHLDLPEGTYELAAFRRPRAN